MATWSWITTPDGYVDVDKGDGQGYQRIEIEPDADTERTLTWIDLVTEKCTKYDVPVPWILAIIYSESQGKPDAENWCCAGLMAIFWTVHHITRAQALDPDFNVNYGTKLVATTYHNGWDLPESASLHNSGGGTTNTPHPSMTSPWGMRENTGDKYGYIERVVRAQNYFRRVLHGIDTKPEPEPDLRLASTEPSSTFSKILPFAAGTIFGYLAVRFTKKGIKKFIV